MIPLGFDQEGSFFVGKQARGRSRWLCLEPRCIQRIINEPKKIPRPKDTPLPISSVIQERLKKHFAETAKKQLNGARKSGLIINGSLAVRNCAKQKRLVILFSSDCGASTRSQISKFHSEVLNYVFPYTSSEIGQLIDRGPRSVLALRPSRKTQSLIDTLRGWASVG